MIGLSLIFAYCINLIFGNLPDRIHPQRWISALAQFYRRRLGSSAEDDDRNSWLLAYGLPFDVVIFTFIVLWIASKTSPYLYFFITIFLIHSTLSVKTVADWAALASARLAEGKLEEARALIQPEGGDLASAGETGLVRRVIETVSLSFLIRIVGPFFYASLGGSALVMFYFTAAFLHAAAGQLGESCGTLREYTGRLMGFLNYLPSRISALVLALGSLFMGGDPKGSFLASFRETEPGSGAVDFTANSFSGALRISFGGFGESENARAPQISDIDRAVTLLYYGSFFALLFSLGISYLVWTN